MPPESDATSEDQIGIAVAAQVTREILGAAFDTGRQLGNKRAHPS